MCVVRVWAQVTSGWRVCVRFSVWVQSCRSLWIPVLLMPLPLILVTCLVQMAGVQWCSDHKYEKYNSSDPPGDRLKKDVPVAIAAINDFWNRIYSFQQFGNRSRENEWSNPCSDRNRRRNRRFMVKFLDSLWKLEKNSTRGVNLSNLFIKVYCNYLKLNR